MAEERTVWDEITLVTLGTATPLDDVYDWGKTKWNRGIGYASAVVDNAMDVIAPDGTEMPVTSIPVYQILKASEDPDDLTPVLFEHWEGRASKARLAMTALDNAPRLEGDRVRLTPDFAYEIYPNEDFEMGSTIPVSEAYTELDKHIENYESEANASFVPPGSTAADKAATFRDFHAAFSPMSVALAGTVPQFARELMGLHLWGDALSGVMNFRNPGSESQYSLFDFFSPYIAMTTAAVTHELTEGF